LPAALLAVLVFLALGWWTTLTLRKIALIHAAEAQPRAT
jgi:hypothetical protein